MYAMCVCIYIYTFAVTTRGTVVILKILCVKKCVNLMLLIFVHTHTYIHVFVQCLIHVSCENASFFCVDMLT